MSRLTKLFDDLEALKRELRILVREIDLVERAIRDVETDQDNREFERDRI